MNLSIFFLEKRSKFLAVFHVLYMPFGINKGTIGQEDAYQHFHIVKISKFMYFKPTMMILFLSSQL